jgi:hypothetical protein
VKVFYGYALAGALMIGAAVVEAVIGVAAERKALEDISEPLGQRG